MICDLEGCENEFRARGLKRHCCIEHKIHAQWIREGKKQLKQRRKAKELNEKARIFAALNCIHYTKCICSVQVNCYNCQQSEMIQDAWQHEPGVLYNQQSDYHSVCLPSNGRGE